MAKSQTLLLSATVVLKINLGFFLVRPQNYIIDFRREKKREKSLGPRSRNELKYKNNENVKVSKVNFSTRDNGRF